MRNYFKPLVLALNLSGLMLGAAHAKDLAIACYGECFKAH